MSLRWIGIALYFFLSLLLVSFVTLKALETVKMPFFGILPYDNLYVGAFTQHHWEGGKRGLSVHDRIVSLNGEKVATGRDVEAKAIEISQSASPSVEAVILQKGDEKKFTLPVSFLSPKDVFVIFAPLLLTGVAFILIGLLAFLISPAPPGLAAFLTYCASAGTYLLTSYDFHSTYQLIPLLLVAFALIPPSVIHLSLSFPRALSTAKTNRSVIFSAYFTSAVFWMSYYLLFYDNPFRWAKVEFVFFLYLSLAYIWWVGATIFRARHDPDDTVRKQCRIILVPLVPAFGTLFVATWLIYVFHAPVPLNLFVPLCSVFPAAVAYAMFRKNLFLVDHLEAQVRERTEALQKTQHELFESKKLAAVGLLSAGTAHEIGNAMNLISSNLPVLKSYSERLLTLAEEATPGSRNRKEIDYEFMKGDLPDLLKNLERGAERASRIAADLKNFSKPEGKEKEPIDLAETVKVTLRLLKAELTPGIRVQTDFAPVPNVLANAGQIQQVILNLILNAIQAMEGNGSLELRLHSNGGGVNLTVQDSGKGIPADQIPRLFEPFFSTKEGGTGLGLSVSYGIVQSHGGQLKVMSEVNKGTRIELQLPIGNS